MFSIRLAKMKLVAGCQVINNVTHCVNPFNTLNVLDMRVEGECVSASIKPLFQAISFLLFLFGTLGNMAYLAVMTRSYQELSMIDLFLVGLSALDIIASIFLPLFYFLEISDLANNFNDSSCRFVTLMQETSLVLTIYLLLFAIRSFYQKIVLGKSNGNTKFRFIVLLIFSLLLAIVPVIPLIKDTHAHDGRCHNEFGSFSSVVIYAVLLFLIQVIFPVLCFTYMFTQLGLYLHSTRRSGDDENNLGAIQRTASRRKLGTLLLITGTFFAFYVPYSLSALWFLLDGGRILEHYIYCHLFDIFHLIVCGKCLANPVIYIAYQEGFRENLKRVICGFRIGRRYNFMHVKYHFRRDGQDGMAEDQRELQDNGTLLAEMGEWQPIQRAVTPPPNPDLELNDKEHDYEEEDTGEDTVAILKPWKNLRS